MELTVKPMLGAKESTTQDVVGLGNTGMGQALVSYVRRGVDAWDVHSGTKLKTWAQPPNCELVAPAVFHSSTKTLLAPTVEGKILVCEATGAALIPTVQSEKLPSMAWRVIPVSSCAESVAVVLSDGSVASCNVRTGAISMCVSPLVAQTPVASEKKRRSSAAAKRKASNDSSIALLTAATASDTLYIIANMNNGDEHALVVSAVSLGGDASAWHHLGVAVLSRTASSVCVAASLHSASHNLFALADDSTWRTYGLVDMKWYSDFASALAACPSSSPSSDSSSQSSPACGSDGVISESSASGALSCVECKKAPVSIAWASKDALLVVGTLTDVWQSRKHVPAPGSQVIMMLEIVFGTALCVRHLDVGKSVSGSTLHLLCLNNPSGGDDSSVTAVVAVSNALFGCDIKLAEVSLGDAISRGLPTSLPLDPPLSVMTSILPRNTWSVAVSYDLDDELVESSSDIEGISDGDGEEKSLMEDADVSCDGGIECEKSSHSITEEAFCRTMPFSAAENAWANAVAEPNEAEKKAITQIAAPETPAAKVFDIICSLLNIHEPKDSQRLLWHLIHARCNVRVRHAVSFHFVQTVAQRVCSEKDVSAIWKSMELLLSRGVVTYCAAPKLLATCMEQDFLSGLELCLLCVKEIPDSAIVAVLRYVLALGEAPLSSFAHDHPFLAKNDVNVVETARDYLLTRVIVLPRNEVFAHKYLKQLSADQVTAFLGFLARWLDELHGTSGSSGKATPLHVVSSECSTSPTLRQVVGWIETLIDAHVSSLVLTPDSQGILTHIAACLRSELSLCREMYTLHPLLAQLKTRATLPQEQIPPYQIEFISF